MLKLDVSKVFDFVKKETIYRSSEEVIKAARKLEDGSGEGSDYLGWLNLPVLLEERLLDDIEKTTSTLRKEVDTLVVVGIGGSYLGSKAVIEALSDSFAQLKTADSHKPVVIFAGQNLGEDYLSELLSLLDSREYGIAVISKSGTTTEPAVAFRILKAHLEKKNGKDAARRRIIAITDKAKGALKKMADNEGYKTYVIPDDVGGRFSVLTPVGLIPIAFAGFSVKDLVKGAADMLSTCSTQTNFEDNPCALYAATRNELYRTGKKIEILANYNSKLVYFSEWWKQLYGESEGKDGKGIYPASVNYTADLHSMGQYIQEGERHIFETVISVDKTDYSLTIPGDPGNLDQLNFISGKHVDHVNKMAELGTMLAHVDGGVPNIRITIERINEYNIGQLIYFFEKACGISGYLLGVNPFNQPGVEAYKNNMFALLEKPGYEEATRKIKSRG